MPPSEFRRAARSLGFAGAIRFTDSLKPLRSAWVLKWTFEISSWEWRTYRGKPPMGDIRGWVDDEGWKAYHYGEPKPFASGPETGHLGRQLCMAAFPPYL
jgi:hypothetical protein